MNPAMIIMCIGICQKIGLMSLLEKYIFMITPGLSSLSTADQAKIEDAIAQALASMSGAA